MSSFKFDPSQPGLRKILREWEELALRCMWDVGEAGANSRIVWEEVNRGLGEGKSISSRARATGSIMQDQDCITWK